MEFSRASTTTIAPGRAGFNAVANAGDVAAAARRISMLKRIPGDSGNAAPNTEHIEALSHYYFTPRRAPFFSPYNTR